MRSQLLSVLKERGFIYQMTHPEELDVACQNPIRGYVGFDATADSLHVGNLVSLMMAKWMQICGHQPILLLGGGTTKIGDPSGREKSRPMMSDDLIEKNKAGIIRNFTQVLDLSPSGGALVVDNAQWLDALLYIPFLREIGVHFTINRMLSFDHISSRLEKDEPLSFVEFNYILLQSYDFFKLHKDYNCILQIGGSDQWGNIVSGVDLVRRMSKQQVYGLTSPLTIASNGEKMGKTAKGAVWLSADKLSVYDYWQFWRNTQDEDVIRFLKLYTLLPLEEIEELARLEGKELNQAKMVLADEATALIHGKEALPSVHLANQALFGGLDVHRQDLGQEECVDISVQELSSSFSLIDALLRGGFVESRSQGKRKIQEKGVKINHQVMEDISYVLVEGDFKDGVCVVCLGKKRGFLRLRDNV